MADIDYLIERDGLQKLRLDGKIVYLHNDHRFVLPLVYDAQEKGLLPKPCKIITLDAHADTCPVKETRLMDIKKMVKGGYNFADLAALTENLSHNDDDWIQAGMHLGLFSDSIFFGVDRLNERRECETIKDMSGNNHHIEARTSLPGPMLGYQGELSDLAYEERYKHLWGLLGWEYVLREGFKFTEEDEKILVDIDLDAFAMRWEDFLFPWPDEVFEDWFLKESDYFTTMGWSGKKFLGHFIDKSGLVTIAREPSCCGGEGKADEIFQKVNKHIFDNGLIET